MTEMPHALPTAMGVDPKAILRMLDTAAEKHIGIQGFAIARHGHVVAKGWYDPYRPDLRHMLFSLSKSFMSTAAGFAVQEGLLSLDAPVTSFFPDMLPSPPCANMQAMEFRHLLGMCTGHQDAEPEIGEDFVRTFLTSYVELKPGSRFLYNTAASCMAGAIIEKVTGCHLDEYLEPRLFAPLGIRDYYWEKLPGDVCTGGFGFNIRTEDIVKFGQFLLQKGMWDGKQLLDAAWIEQATSCLIIQPEKTPDWHSGYGFQFWRCAREDAYRGDGAFGQLCVVIPKHDMVLAVNAGLSDMQEEMDLFFDTLIPGLSEGPLPEDPEAQAELERRCASLRLDTPAGSPTDPAASAASGVRYALGTNQLELKEIRLDFGEEEDQATLVMKGGPVTIPVGHGKWANYAAKEDRPGTFGNEIITSCSAAGAWKDGAYRLRIYHNTTPFADDLLLRFQEGGVEIRYSRNVGFEPVDLVLMGIRK